MKPILSLSTSWCSYRHQDGYQMLKEMADLGFEYAELSHGIRITLVPGILRAVEEGVIKIGTTHNFCPLPTGVLQAAPNLFEPSSGGSQEHEQWLRHTKRSLDFAEQLKARLMVLHLGSVHFFWSNPSRVLKAFGSKNPEAGADDPAYQKVLSKALTKLRRKMPPFLDQVRASLNEVRDYAVQKNIKLGCENREKFEELPLDPDFESLLASLDAPHTAGYWHDTGHACIKENMGLLDHRKHLEANADRLLGCHLHDVDERGRDHQPVGSGKIDFEMVSSFWRPEHILVLELSPRVEEEGVRASKARIEELLRARGLW